MYGYDVESIDDPYVTKPDQSMKIAVRLVTPGVTLINIFPILASIPPWFPGATAQKLAAEVRRLTDEILGDPIKWAKMRLVCHLEILLLFENFDH